MKSNQKGVYLLELLVGILLFIIVIIVIFQSLIVSNNWLQDLSYRTSALALIQDKMEEILSDSYSQIIEGNYPEDYPVITFGDSEGGADDIVGTRTVTIIPFDHYKEITVNITWPEKGREESESLYSLVTSR